MNTFNCKCTNVTSSTAYLAFETDDASLLFNYLILLLACITLIVESAFVYCAYQCRKIHGTLKPAVLCLLQRSIGDAVWVTSWSLYFMITGFSVVSPNTYFVTFKCSPSSIVTFFLTLLNDFALGHSISMLVILSVIRSRAVINPHEARTLNAKRVFLGAVICSCIFTIPDKVLDVFVSPDIQTASDYKTWVRLVQFVFLYLAPLIIVTMSYRRMHSALRKSNTIHAKSPGNASAQKAIKRRENASRRLIPFVVTFFLGWGPYWLTHIVDVPKHLRPIRQLTDTIVIISYTINAIYTGFSAGHLRSHIWKSTSLQKDSRRSSVNSLQLLPTIS